MRNLLENFKCPKCKGKGLRAVMTNATVVADVLSFEGIYDIQYGIFETSSDGVVHYECNNCEKRIANSMKELEEKLNN